MGNGAHGDLFPIRFLQLSTPVNFLETNEPLEDLETNILIIDGKLAEHLANHPGGLGGGGGGSPVASTGTLSHFIDTFEDIAGGGTPPAAGTVGTDLDALVFADAADENQKFEVTVPQDYDSDDLMFHIQFTMSASGGGDVDFDLSGEVAQIDGTVTSFGPTASGLSVLTNTDPQSILLFLLQSTSFSPGDRIRIQLERQGTTDANSDDLNMLGIDMRYTGLLAGNRAHTREIVFTSDTDEPAPVTGTFGTDLDTLDFPTGSDAEQKLQAITPEEWDDTSDPFLKLTYAMSTAVGGSIVRLGIDGEVANVSTGLQTLVTQQVDLAVPGDTEAERSVSIPFPAGLFSKGSVYLIKFARRTTAVPSNHTGSFKVLGVEMIFNKPGTSGGGGGSGGGFTEEYLTSWSFGNAAGAPSPTADVDYPAFAGDFEILYSMLGNAASSRVDVSFQGRIPDGFATIDELTVGIKGAGGTPEYLLKVFVEGSGATPVYDPTSGTPIAAPGTLGVTTIAAGALSAQPLGSRRFFVVVEAHVDVAETVFASRPFVKYA